MAWQRMLQQIPTLLEQSALARPMDWEASPWGLVLLRKIGGGLWGFSGCTPRSRGNAEALLGCTNWGHVSGSREVMATGLANRAQTWCPRLLMSWGGGQTRNQGNDFRDGNPIFGLETPAAPSIEMNKGKVTGGT